MSGTLFSGGGPRDSIGHMETWDAIRARRNVRQFQDRPIDRADLERILDAGRRAPTAKNRQWWDAVVVTDRQQLQDLSGMWTNAGHVATSAATVVLITEANDDARLANLVRLDLGQAIMSMMIAATDLGIGSGHASVGPGEQVQELARKVLGHPEDRRAAFMVAFGYPADRPLAPIEKMDRRPLDEIVHYGHW
jgi:nitroreductase